MFFGCRIWVVGNGVGVDEIWFLVSVLVEEERLVVVGYLTRYRILDAYGAMVADDGGWVEVAVAM